MPSPENKFKTFPRIVPLTKSDFVGAELIRRKKGSFGKNAIPRAVWLRAISNAVKVNEDGKVIKDIVGSLNVIVGGLLSEKFNTRGSFETLYRRPGRQIKDKPIPGIDSISITSKGELQSLRKVTINWSCPSIEDLDELAPYWLTPGVSVWVEWGWAQVGKTPIVAPVKNVGKLKEYYLDAGKIYEDIIRVANGNQDGYIGVITNFSFTQNEDGSWTCTTELTSLGQTLLALDLNKDKIYQSASTEDAKKEGIKKTQTIKGFIEETFSEGDLLKLDIPKGNARREAGFKTWKDSQDVFNASKTALGMDWLASDQIYVSWRFIEQQIINEADAWEFDGEGGKGKAFEMNSEGVEISNDPFLFSTKAEVGLVVHIPGNGAFSFDANNSKSTKLSDGKTDSKSTKLSDGKTGYMTNLYFESEFVKETFLTAETLEEALMKLLRGISNVCADIWDFKLQPNPLAETQLQAIDLNVMVEEDLNDVQTSFSSDSDSGDRILSFGGYSGESILSSVSFTTKLTDQLAMKYVVSRNKSEKSKDVVVNADNDAGVKTMFGGYVDRIIYPLDPPPSPPETVEERKKRIDKENAKKKKRKNYSISLLELKKALETGTAIKNSESGWPANIIVLEEEGKELLVEYINRNLKTRADGSVTENRLRHKPLYPLEISVTIDGIGGILPGNCFVLDNVPKLYKKSGVFQIVEVGHDISSDDWTTNLRCFFRYISDQKEVVIYYDPNKKDAGDGASGEW